MEISIVILLFGFVVLPLVHLLKSGVPSPRHIFMLELLATLGSDEADHEDEPKTRRFIAAA